VSNYQRGQDFRTGALFILVPLILLVPEQQLVQSLSEILAIFFAVFLDVATIMAELYGLHRLVRCTTKERKTDLVSVGSFLATLVGVSIIGSLAWEIMSLVTGK